MRKILLPILAVILSIGFSTSTYADHNDVTKTHDNRNIFERIGDAVVDIFTGGDDDEHDHKTGKGGNSNALEQIDRNIEKHGGSHHGLENARRNVAKNKSYKDHDDDDDKGLIEEVAEDIADDIEEASDDIFNTDDARHHGYDDEDHPGKGKKKHGNNR